MKKKIVFALLLAGMSFLAPNVADACSVTSCGQTCNGVECFADSSGVVCRMSNGKIVDYRCPRVVAEP